MKTNSAKSKKLESISIFVNGPYQMLVGIACAKKHFIDARVINVIPYDLRWFFELNQTVRLFADLLNVNLINLPIEFRKMNVQNFRTFPLRALINHFLFIFYSYKYCGEIILVPKLYGSPERAIVFGSRNKNIFVFDDGYGIYINPLINKGVIDNIWEKTSRYFRRNRINTVRVYPCRPELVSYDNLNSIKVSSIGYSKELQNIIEQISATYHHPDLEYLQDLIGDKGVIIISLPRLAISNRNKIWQDIKYLITQVNEKLSNPFFIIKPHPRDSSEYGDLLSLNHGNRINFMILPKSLSGIPVEVLANIVNAKIILTGFSTIGINQSLLKKSRVMIFEFLSFDLPGYNEPAKNIMVKAGSYYGESLDEAVGKTILYFSKPIEYPY